MIRGFGQFAIRQIVESPVTNLCELFFRKFVAVKSTLSLRVRMHELVIDHARRLAPEYDGSWTTDTLLGANGAGLDSIGILDLVLALEQASGRELRTETLDSGALATVGSLAAFLLAQPSK